MKFNAYRLLFFLLVILAPILWEVSWMSRDLRYHLDSRVTDQIFPDYARNRMGLTEIEYDIYRDFYTQDGLVLNPSTFHLGLTDEVSSFVTQEELPEDGQAAVDVWRSDKTADNLRAAGIDFLFVNAEWWSFITDEEFQIMNDPAQYELVSEAANNFGFLRVYRVNSS